MINSVNLPEENIHQVRDKIDSLHGDSVDIEKQISELKGNRYALEQNRMRLIVKLRDMITADPLLNLKEILPPKTTPIETPSEAGMTPGVGMMPFVSENMELVDKEWHSVDQWRFRVAALHFGFTSQIAYGSYITISLERKGSVKYTGPLNVKVLRLWRGKVGGYPNSYYGRQADGSWLFYTEKLPAKTGLTRAYGKYPEYTEEWREELWQIRMPSKLGAHDGAFSLTVDGVPYLVAGGLQMDDANNPGVPNIVCIQDDASNAILPPGSWVAYRNIEIKVL